MRNLSVALAAAVAFDLGCFTVASAVMPSDIYLKLETRADDGPPKKWSDIDAECSSDECKAARTPTINAAGCELISGLQVQVDGQAMCKVTPPKPAKPKVGLRIGVPIPGTSGSGTTAPPDR